VILQRARRRRDKELNVSSFESQLQVFESAVGTTEASTNFFAGCMANKIAMQGLILLLSCCCWMFENASGLRKRAKIILHYWLRPAGRTKKPQTNSPGLVLKIANNAIISAFFWDVIWIALVIEIPEQHF
jgi:hypothetical protein